MTKKDYIRAAEIVRDIRKYGTTPVVAASNDTLASIVENTFCSFFLGDNARFDEDKFRNACKEEER